MHVEAVLPGVTVSPNAVLSQLEREPGEPVVDPWVTHRHTLVAVVREAVVGAAHLLRYADEERVGVGYRGLGEIRWLLVGPGRTRSRPPRCGPVADALTAAAARPPGRCRPESPPTSACPPRPSTGSPTAGRTSRRRFPGGLPTRGAGRGRARRGDRRPAARRPRSRAGSGAAGGAGRARHRFSAVHDGAVIGFYEADTDLTQGGTRSRLAGWADGWELWTAPVAPPPRRRDLAARARRRPHALRGRPPVLDYAILAPEPPDGTYPFLRHVGFHELTRTTRAWTLQ
jgi:hypothetical protein